MFHDFQTAEINWIIAKSVPIFNESRLFDMAALIPNLGAIIVSEFWMGESTQMKST